MDLTKYKHIVWDWNGTLLDDAWLCLEIINEMAVRRKMPPVTHKKYQEVFDIPVIDFYIRLGYDLSAESFDDIANEFIGEYDRRRFECKLQDGAMEALELCARKGLGQSILTAYQKTRLLEVMDHFQLGKYFTHLAGSDDHYSNGKVENGKRLLKQLNIKAADVLVVGDTVHDFHAADAIGSDCVLIPSGHHSKEKLSTCQTEVPDSLNDFFKDGEPCN